ncbi:MAG: UbiA family prenyltransferase [Verrucomicrobiae bacterium]|nr:UbiA family prenyltransferase [Verrucomicrobiae bacterium]
MPYNVAHVVKTAANKEVTIAATLRAWGQLVRLPMLPTALADPLAGWWVSGQQLPMASFALVLVASVCLYAAGMVWNDWFDYRLDCRERPERPLPQGAISRGSAALVAGLLMVTGMVAAVCAGRWSGYTAAGLVGLIFLYDAWTKHWRFLGPVTMGSCRALNFALAWHEPVGSVLWMPVVLGGYVAGVTAYAAGEVQRPARRARVRWALRGIVVVDALLVAVSGSVTGAAVVLGLLVPVVLLGRWWEST